MQNGVSIVTGSSSGVGAACARQLAERGSHVVINYVNNEAGAKETQAACEALGVETTIVRADVAHDGVDLCRDQLRRKREDVINGLSVLGSDSRDRRRAERAHGGERLEVGLDARARA